MGENYKLQPKGDITTCGYIFKGVNPIDTNINAPKKILYSCFDPLGLASGQNNRVRMQLQLRSNSTHSSSGCDSELPGEFNES